MDETIVKVSDDWALLAAYARNHAQEPFARLAGKYSPMVFATALRRTRRADVAEDVTQAVFIVLARRAGELKPRGSLGAWLHRTTLLASSEALRAEQRRRKHERRAAEATSVAVYDSSPRDPADEAAVVVEDALRRLRGRDRQVLSLRYLEGRSVRETAAALGLTEAAARKRLTRALHTLRDRLAGEGVARTLAGTGSAVAALGKTSAATPTVSLSAGGATGAAFDLADGVLRTLRLLALKQAAVVALVVMMILGFGVTLASELLSGRAARATPPAAKTGLAQSEPATLPSYLPPERGVALTTSDWSSSGWAIDNDADAQHFSLEVAGNVTKFVVLDPGKWHVWIRNVEPVVDLRRYPILVMQYRSTAAGVPLGMPARYALWLDDGTGPNVGGLYYCPPDYLIHDGRMHTFRADLRKRDTKNQFPRGPISGMALGVCCKEKVPATFELLALRFEVPP